MTVTPEQLAAFADGQLEGDEARTVAAAIAADPALHAEVEAHRALRARLVAHFAPLADEPVPERLRAAAQGGWGAGGDGEVIDLIRARAARSPARRPAWLRYAAPALAASLLVAFLGFNVSGGRGYARGALADALDHQLAVTTPVDAPVRILLSFHDHAGQYCRAFREGSDGGIACRDDHGWRLRGLPGGGEGPHGEYRQAGSDIAIMAAAQAMAAGPALDARQEAEASRRGWRR